MASKLRSADHGGATAVAVAALLSRLAIFALQWVCNGIVTDYDTSSAPLEACGVGSGSCDGVAALTTSVRGADSAADRLVLRALGGFAKWDAVFFLRLARSRAYDFELFHAFSPLLPAAIDALCGVAAAATRAVGAPAALLLNDQAARLLAGVVLSNAAFVLAATTLYQLGLLVLDGNRRVAFVAAVLFCCNPASVFMSAVYTESLFAFLSFAGMLEVLRGRRARATVLFALCSLCRGNGFLCAGFLVHGRLRRIIGCLAAPFPTHQPHRRRNHWLLDRAPEVAWQGVLGAFELLAVVAPFCWTQLVAYWAYCAPCLSDGGGDMPWQPRPWCEASPLPLVYGFVQRHYWNNGFLAYWRPAQLPNFALALPMWIVAVSTVTTYARGHGCLLRSLFVPLPPSPPPPPPRHGRSGPPSMTSSKCRWCAFRAPPHGTFVVYLAVLSLVSLLFMHVQVTTRFISASCPSIYWYAAIRCAASWATDGNTALDRPESKDCAVCGHRDVEGGADGGKVASALVAYFLSFALLGTALHCNFYPFT